MLFDSNSGRPFSIAILVSDPRAALVASERMRHGRRRIDGPFLLWEGELRQVPVVIVVPQPGGASAWFAAVKLAHRRFQPAMVLGVTPFWCLRAEGTAVALAATEVVDLARDAQTLSDVESTLDGPLPPRILAGLDPSGWPRYESPAVSEALVAALDAPGKPTSPLGSSRAGQTSVESRLDAPAESSGMRVRLGRLGCWPGTRFESRAVARCLLEEHGIDAMDRESAGLAEAATELEIPWSVLGPCNPLDDPYQAARNTRRGHDDAQAPVHRLLVSILNAVSLGRAPIP